MRKPEFKKISRPESKSFVIVISRKGFVYGCTFAEDSTEEMVINAIRDGYSDSPKSWKPFKPFNETTGCYLR